MNCKEVEERINEYLDGCLSQIESENVQVHLLKCKNCYEEFIKLKNAVKMMSTAQNEDVPPEFYTSLEKKIEYLALPLHKKLVVYLNLQNFGIALGGVLIGIAAGGFIFKADAAKTVVVTETSAGKKANVVKVKTQDLAKVKAKVKELQEKYDAKETFDTKQSDKSNKYVVELNEKHYNEFMNDLNRTGNLRGRNSKSGNSRGDVTPVKVNIEFEEEKENENR